MTNKVLQKQLASDMGGKIAASDMIEMSQRFKHAETCMTRLIIVT